MVHVEFTNLIAKEITIDNLNMRYHVGITQVKLNFTTTMKTNQLKNEEEGLNFIFKLIETIQSRFKDSTVQFFKPDYVLNPNHVFFACYFTQKAFYNNINISNSKNIELFLYLSTKRQIKKGIEAYGITIEDLNSSILTYCVMSPINNLELIDKEIFTRLNGEETEFTLDSKKINKLTKIKSFFKISGTQLNTVLRSLEESGTHETDDLGLEILAIQDLICEKMALLSLEKM